MEASNVLLESSLVFHLYLNHYLHCCLFDVVFPLGRKGGLSEGRWCGRTGSPWVWTTFIRLRSHLTVPVLTCFPGEMGVSMLISQDCSTESARPKAWHTAQSILASFPKLNFLSPEKLSGFFPPLNIEVKSREQVADREFFFLYKVTKWAGKEEGMGKLLPRESWKLGCFWKGERHQGLEEGSWGFMPSQTPCWAGTYVQKVPRWWSLNPLGNKWAMLVPPTGRCDQINILIVPKEYIGKLRWGAMLKVVSGLGQLENQLPGRLLVHLNLFLTPLLPKL